MCVCVCVCVCIICRVNGSDNIKRDGAQPLIAESVWRGGKVERTCMQIQWKHMRILWMKGRVKTQIQTRFFF